jgi:hypothetical protein
VKNDIKIGYLTFVKEFYSENILFERYCVTENKEPCWMRKIRSKYINRIIPLLKFSKEFEFKVVYSHLCSYFGLKISKFSTSTTRFLFEMKDDLSQSEKIKLKKETHHFSELSINEEDAKK